MILQLIKKVFRRGRISLRLPMPESDMGDKTLRKGEMLELERINARLEKLETDLIKTAAGYKDLLLRNNPDILPELITGKNIDELDQSAAAARTLTRKIKEQLEAQTTAEKIPGGAPVRAPPDTSILSPYEKIRYGLEEKEGNQF